MRRKIHIKRDECERERKKGMQLARRLRPTGCIPSSFKVPIRLQIKGKIILFHLGWNFKIPLFFVEGFNIYNAYI